MFFHSLALNLSALHLLSSLLSCLTLVTHTVQVGALTVGAEYDSHFQTLYKFFVAQLQLLLPPGTNIPEAYSA